MSKIKKTGNTIGIIALSAIAIIIYSEVKKKKASIATSKTSGEFNNAANCDYIGQPCGIYSASGSLVYYGIYDTNCVCIQKTTGTSGREIRLSNSH